MLSLVVLALSAVACADIPWPSDFWEQVERHRQAVAPTGGQIGTSESLAFESGGRSFAWQDEIGIPEDPFDALTRTWMESNGINRFTSFPSIGFLLFFR